MVQTTYHLAESDSGLVGDILCGQRTVLTLHDGENRGTVAFIGGTVGIGFRLALGQFGYEFSLDFLKVFNGFAVEVRKTCRMTSVCGS